MWLFLIAAACPLGWISVPFADQRGKPVMPGTGAPPAGIGLMALYVYVQTVGVGILAAISVRRPEVREVATILLTISLLAIALLSTFSMIFAPSRLARAGLWFGWIGLASLMVSLTTPW